MTRHVYSCRASCGAHVTLTFTDEIVREDYCKQQKNIPLNITSTVHAMTTTILKLVNIGKY